MGKANRLLLKALCEMEGQKLGGSPVLAREIPCSGVLFKTRHLRDLQAMGLVSRYLIPAEKGRFPNRYVLPKDAPRAIRNPPGKWTTGEHQRLGSKPATGPLVEAWTTTPMGWLINKNLEIAIEHGPDAVQEHNLAS